MKQLFLILTLLVGFNSFSQVIPEKMDRLVNDYAGVLSDSEERQLEAELDA